MDILLIQPPKLPGIKKSRGAIPVSLLHLASYVRKFGHTPHISDYSVLQTHMSGDTAKILAGGSEKIAETGSGLIGINCFTTMHFPLVKDIADKIRKENPNIKICIGGCHPTHFPEEILRNCDSIDYIILGEGEEPLAALADILQNEDEGSLENIQALAYKSKDGNVIINPRQNYLKDIVSLPMPAWDLIEFSDYYSDYSCWYNPKKTEIKLGVPIITSRSCPFNCSFCAAHLVMGKGYRKRSHTHVVDEIELLNRKFDQNYFMFIDDNFALQKNHVIEICEEICKRGLDIQFAVPQGLYIPSVDEEVVEALAAAGCVTVSIPIESGSEYIRNSIIGKNISTEKIFSVVDYFKKKEIFTVGLFIMGFPEETVETLEETVKMIKQLALDVNSVATLTPFPETKIFEQAKKDNLLLFDSKDIWRGDMSLDPISRDRFFLRPYNLQLSRLREYRKMFDSDSMYFFSKRAKALNLIPQR